MRTKEGKKIMIEEEGEKKNGKKKKKFEEKSNTSTSEGPSRGQLWTVSRKFPLSYGGVSHP